MFILSFLFPNPKPVYIAPNISHFKEDEKKCYNEIVSYFLKNSEARSSHSFLSPTPERQTYYITFCRSASWTDLEALFKAAKDKTAYPEIIDDWLKLIEQVNSLNKARSDRLSEESSYTDQLKVAHHQAMVKLTDQWNNKAYREDNALKSCLNALVYHWQKFWVFVENKEIPLNSRGLHVKVGLPKEEVNLEFYVNRATKAVLVVEETECESVNWPISPQVEAIKIIRPKKIEVQRKVFGPQTPHAINKTFQQGVQGVQEVQRLRESGSQIQLQEAHFPFVIQEMIEEGMRVTADAIRIDEIVTKALSEVNARLAEKPNGEF
ncbi:hypothetical protein [Candidatus Protochlamydia phocaeensis]|uniref:hypothetical protein n=1 Tax=Candidatus Protochlamydia phocaeensis TaxID=1414722 RepID=UPI00083873C5|nr:hypothetical protein [Candidatus Protochlamydia phocaeensis]